MGRLWLGLVPPLCTISVKAINVVHIINTVQCGMSNSAVMCRKVYTEAHG
jgi:hypothetical protein